MGRRKLAEVEPAGEPPAFVVDTAATTRVVSERSVLGATCLRTIDVSASHPLPAMGTGTLSGVMVRLRPVGLCTADDMDFAEQCVRKAGALTVSRMPLTQAEVLSTELGMLELPDEELAVLPLIEALDANLNRQMDREGCSDVEREETLRLAHQMLEQAGG